jgi:hypothetical protein
MSWNPDEYPDVGDDADQVLQQLEASSVEEQQSVEQTLSAAVKRIEEANLFKLLITRDVFSEGSASPEILLSVNQKMKKFALDQLNELLGISQPKPQKEVAVKSEFDREEVQALRVLAAKILKRDVAQVVTQSRTPDLNPISSQGAHLNMNTIGPVNTSTPSRNQNPMPTSPKPESAQQKRPGRRPNAVTKKIGSQVLPDSGMLPMSINQMPPREPGLVIAEGSVPGLSGQFNNIIASALR